MASRSPTPSTATKLSRKLLTATKKGSIAEVNKILGSRALKKSLSASSLQRAAAYSASLSLEQQSGEATKHTKKQGGSVDEVRSGEDLNSSSSPISRPPSWSSVVAGGGSRPNSLNSGIASYGAALPSRHGMPRASVNKPMHTLTTTPVKGKANKSDPLSTADDAGWAPLHHAADAGHAEITAALMKAGANPCARTLRAETPLHRAARSGRGAVVALLVQGPDAALAIGARDADGSTPLFWAAGAAGSAEAVMALLEAGADPSVVSSKGLTPLHAAAASGAVHAVEALLEGGAPVDVPDLAGRTPLALATAAGAREAAVSLIAGGADLNDKDVADKSPLDNAKDEAMKRALLQAMQGVNSVFSAVKSGSMDDLRTAINSGAPTRVRLSGTRATPLHIAAQTGNLQMVRWLLLHGGASVHDVDARGNTALHIAASSGKIAVLNHLVETAGADPSAINAAGRTPAAEASFWDFTHAETYLAGAMEASSLVAPGSRPGLGLGGSGLPPDPSTFGSISATTTSVSSSTLSSPSSSPTGSPPLGEALSPRRCMSPRGDGELQGVVLHASIGGGAFGDVYRGSWSGQLVAVKVPRGDVKEADFLAEVDMLAGLSHPNICQVYGHSRVQLFPLQPPKPAAVLYYYGGGSLSSILDESGPLSEAVIAKWASQIAIAGSWLHNKGLMHRDIAARNVLVSSDRRTVHLADFGLAKHVRVNSRSINTAGAGALQWTAPEVLSRDGAYSFPADVYAFGSLLYEMATGTAPWGDLSAPSDLARVVTQLQSGSVPTIPSSVPRWVANIIRACWAKSPRDRPTFESLRAALASQANSIIEENISFPPPPSPVASRAQQFFAGQNGQQQQQQQKEQAKSIAVKAQAPRRQKVVRGPGRKSRPGSAELFDHSDKVGLYGPRGGKPAHLTVPQNSNESPPPSPLTPDNGWVPEPHQARSVSPGAAYGVLPESH